MFGENYWIIKKNSPVILETRWYLSLFLYCLRFVIIIIFYFATQCFAVSTALWGRSSEREASQRVALLRALYGAGAAFSWSHSFDVRDPISWSSLCQTVRRALTTARVSTVACFTLLWAQLEISHGDISRGSADPEMPKYCSVPNCRNDTGNGNERKSFYK